MKRYIIQSEIPGIVGNSHRYETEKGKIYLVYPCYATRNTYEICCIEGKLFEDVERFSSIEEAESVIKKYLGVKEEGLK